MFHDFLCFAVRIHKFLKLQFPIQPSVMGTSIKATKRKRERERKRRGFVSIAYLGVES